MIIWILENTREHQFKTSVNVRAVVGSTRRYHNIPDVFLQNVGILCVWEILLSVDLIVYWLIK